MVEIISRLFSVGTVLLHVGIGVAFLLFLVSDQLRKSAFAAIVRNSNGIIFALSLSGVFGSLFYSQIMGFTPCMLCWWQRIFLYPIAGIYGVAIIKKHKNPIDYGLALAVPGLLVTVYHYYIEWGGTMFATCLTGNETVSCARRYVFEYGYVSIPLMAMTLFVLIVATLFITKRQQRTS